MTLAKLLPETIALHEAAERAARAQTAAPQVHKYVVVEGWHGPYVLVFSKQMEHKEAVAEGRKVLSAGFVAVVSGVVKVASGVPSETLKVGPRPEDQQLLETFFSI